jgi:hypothetical protein
MDIVFTQPQLLQDEFKYAMYFWALIVVIFGVILSSRVKKVNVYICSCLALYAIAVAVCYGATFSQFTQASVDDKYIVLNYTSLNGDKEKVIAKSEIKEVLYGSPNKTNNHCYVSITTQSGVRYKSSTVAAKPEKCKQMTQQFKK